MGWKVAFFLLLGILIASSIFAITYFYAQKTSQSPSISSTNTTKDNPTPTQEPTPTRTITSTADESQAIKQAVLDKIKLNENQAIVTVLKNTGQHASGGIKEIGEAGGAMYLAAKVNDKWVIVFDGQTYPTCIQIEPYSFPQDMVPECLDANSQITKR